MSEKQISKMMGNFVAHQGEYGTLPKAYRQWMLENPKEAIAVHVAAIRKFLCKPVSMNKVWKRLFIERNLHAADTLIKRLEREAYYVSREAIAAIQKMEISDVETAYSSQLVKISPFDLGFRAYVDFNEFLQAVWASGLSYLPQDIAAAFRLYYVDQPAENWLGVISKPFKYEDDVLGIFALKHVQGKRSLEIYKYRKNFPVDSREEFVVAVAERKCLSNKREKI